MSSALETCALCPRLCRPACPVAVGSAREAAVPAVIAEVLLAWRRGAVSDALARDAATLCVDCGACQDHCHLHVPLPEALRAARDALLPTVVVAPVIVDGDGEWIAIEADERPWGAALARVIGRPVAVVRTPDGLGAAALGRATFGAHADALRAALGGRRVVVAGGDAATVLAAAGIEATWLHEVLPELAGPRASCCQREGPVAGCCGARGPLAAHHPESADRLAAAWADGGLEQSDDRCGRWLRARGYAAVDPVDRLLALEAS